MKMDIGDIEVFTGIDVGKSKHWVTALSRDGQKVPDRALPNGGDQLHKVYQRLQAKGQVSAVVDQPITIGALAVAVTQDMGITVGYLLGLSMCRIIDLIPGSAKTGAKGVAIIARVARITPHTLRAISTSDENMAALSILTGFDLDLTRQVNRTANRTRGLYTRIHPVLEWVLGSWLEHDTVLKAVAVWLTPANLKRAGKARIDARLKKHGYKRHAAWASQIVLALEHQVVVVAGTDAVAAVLPHLTRQLVTLCVQRADVAVQVETLVQAHPLYRALISMLGIGVRTVAAFSAEALGRTFSTGAQPASYAGLVPVTYRFDSSIHGEHISYGGNKRLKCTMLLSVFASLCPDPISRTYYQRKRDQGKRHNQVAFVLVHRRILTLHAMIHDDALYDPQSATKLPAAA